MLLCGQSVYCLFGEEKKHARVSVGACIFPDGCEFHKVCLGCSTCVYVGCKVHG